MVRSIACRVSIPAPAQGATYNGIKNRCYMPLFQFPPPRRGRRARRAKGHADTDSFNSRPRAGGDGRAVLDKVAFIRFNSRPRAGGDLMVFIFDTVASVSIPAPAQGATTPSELENAEQEMFPIPRPRAGRLKMREARGWSRFNSRPRAGATVSLSKIQPKPKFQFPPPRRPATPSRPSLHQIVKISFNSRPRAGATDINCNACGARLVSIPAPAQGRPMRYTGWKTPTPFQFPPPRRGDMRQIRNNALQTSFNSRPRAGGDGRC